MSLERLVAALESAGVWHRVTGDRVQFRCPLPDHADETASGWAHWHGPDARKAVGRVTLVCHGAGCGRPRTPELVAALGLSFADLHDDAPRRPDPSSPRAGRAPSTAAPARSSAPRRTGPAPSGSVDKSAPPRKGPTRRTTRVFCSADGAELFQLHRYDPIGPDAAQRKKSFSWKHRGGPRGGWRTGQSCTGSKTAPCESCREGRTPGVVPLLRLPELTAAVAADARVWVCEGGKNADDLAAVLPAGEVATTAPDGANTPWQPEHTATLAGALVTVVADRDAAGYRYAATVAGELRAAGCAVRVVRTPLEVEKADASDHVAAGYGLDAFEDVPDDVLAQTAPVASAGAAAVPNLDDKRAARQGQRSEPSGPSGDDETSGKGGGGGSQARRLLELALELFEPIWTTTGECYLVPVGGPRIARPLRGGARSFSAELVAEFYDRTGSVAFNYAVTDALKVVQGIAQRCAPIELANRVARDGDALVLDLGDDTGRTVVVTAQGWEVVDESPVLFARTARTGALPVPERGGDGLDELWRVVHVRPRDRGLAEAELVHRYFSGVSHPLPLFTGEAGSGKTSAAETLTALVDPAPAMKVSIPNDPKDWAVQIGQAYSLVLDNVSTLQQWQSDALCMAVTGGFTQYRALYTDGGLARFGGQQCIALTSVDLGAQRADLTTRLLPIELERFAEHERLSESEWATARDESRARVLGVLLDRAAAVLATLPRVDALGLDLPRLSDFARTCKALDLIDADRGVAADRYGEYVRLVGQQAGDIADEDEVAAAVVELVATRDAAGRGPWKGTTKELHAELGRASLSRSRFWPETPIALGKRLSSVVGPLREAGVIVDRSERTAGRRVTALYRAPEAEGDSRPAESPSAGPPAPAAGEGPVGPGAGGDAASTGTSCTASTQRDDPAPSSAGPFAPAGDDTGQPCATCTAAGPSCGLGGIADAPAPCVLCGEDTSVRARCGAPRHGGNCRRGGGPGPAAPAPDPDPGPTGAQTPADGPARPTATRAPAPRETTSERPSRPGPTRAAPRRGLHLYGVLDSDALTVITDRQAGPSEPLGEAYPADLDRGCVELARRHGLEALWVHDSALGRLGRPTDDEPPDGAEGWRVVDRGDPAAVELAVPLWLRGTSVWADAESGRELAQALALYEAALGMRFRTAPAAMAPALLGMLHKRSGARELVAPEALPAREVCASERELSWARALSGDEQRARWVIGLDKHAAYPGVMKDLRLGMGDPAHYPDGAYDAKIPGRHRVTAATAAPGRDPRLPDPMTGVTRDGQWRCTETLRYAAEQGVTFTVAESYVWPDTSKPLAMFGERVRHARTDLRTRVQNGDPGAGIAFDALKETYAAIGGALSSRDREQQDRPGALYRPDWTGTMVAKARVNILRNLDKLPAPPFAANVDEVFFAVESDDPAAIGLPLGDGAGQWAVKTPALPMAALADAITAAAEKGRPAPLLRRARELHGGNDDA